jgi:hypothetical protein
MNREILRRLMRLETEAVKTAKRYDPKTFAVKMALMAIVAHHVGRRATNESIATAYARSLNLNDRELKHKLANSRDDLWAKTIAQLKTLVEQRGGRLKKTSAEDGNFRDGFEVLAELYNEIPEDMKATEDAVTQLTQ